MVYLVTSYYRTYKCKAENPLGVAFHDIELQEAHKPTVIQQVIVGMEVHACKPSVIK